MPATRRGRGGGYIIYGEVERFAPNQTLRTQQNAKWTEWLRESSGEANGGGSEHLHRIRRRHRMRCVPRARPMDDPRRIAQLAFVCGCGVVLVVVCRCFVQMLLADGVAEVVVDDVVFDVDPRGGVRLIAIVVVRFVRSVVFVFVFVCGLLFVWCWHAGLDNDNHRRCWMVGCVCGRGRGRQIDAIAGGRGVAIVVVGTTTTRIRRAGRPIGRQCG